MDVRKFCQQLLQNGFVSPSRLDESLKIFKNFRATGISKTLWDILIEKEYLTHQQFASLAMEFGPYQLCSFLGKGNTATVYKARQLQSGRFVALKIMLDKRGDGDRDLQRFRREVQTVLSLHHPNLIQGYDCGEDHGNRYFAMELVDGSSLKGLLKDKGPLPEAEALFYLGEITKALEYIASKHLVHRDIKPDNIMIMPPDKVKLCDLGLAKWVGGEESYKTLTRAGAIVGTPYYVSPELIKGQKDIDIRSDFYSLGATFFHLILGEPPFKGSSAPVVFNMHLIKKIAPYRDFKGMVSREMYYLLKRMLEKEPSERHGDCAELWEDIQLVQRGEMPQGHGQVSSLRVPERKSSLGLWIGVGVAFLCLNAVLMYFFFFSSESKKPGGKKISSGPKTTKDSKKTMPLLLRKIQQKMTSSSPQYWALYEQLSHFIQTGPAPKWREKAVRWKRDLKMTQEVRTTLELQRQLAYIEKSFRGSLGDPWALYQLVQQLGEQYKTNPLFPRIQALQKKLEDMPAIKAFLLSYRQLQNLKQKVRAPGADYLKIYNQLVRLQTNLGKGRGNKKISGDILAFRSVLETKKDVKRSLCLWYLQRFFKLSPKNRKTGVAYLNNNRTVATEALVNFFSSIKKSPDFRKYLRFFKNFALKKLLISKVQKVLEPKLKGEGGVMRYPFVISMGNRKCLAMYYVCGKTTFHGTKIGYAESKDAIHWTKQQILFEVPSWVPNQRGNHWKSFLSFSYPVVVYDPQKKMYHLFVNAKWGGELAFYLLRYTSKDGLHWTTKQDSYHLVSPISRPYYGTALVPLRGGDFYLWSSANFKTLTLFSFRNGKRVALRKSFSNQGFNSPYTILPWKKKSLLLHFWYNETNNGIYYLSPNGLDWWGRGRVFFDKKYPFFDSPLPPPPHGYILDPVNKTDMRVYFHVKDKIYSGVLR